MNFRAIYSIENIINHKVYIGSAVDLYRRWDEHKKLLRKNKHDNKYLQNAWNKYGETNFKFILIECVSEKVDILEREQYWMDIFFCYEEEFGYNICRIAGNILGVKRSKETCIKIGLARKGSTHTEEWKKETSERMIGHDVSEKTKKKISVSNTGKKASDKTRKSISDGHRNFEKWPCPDGFKCNCPRCRKIKSDRSLELYHFNKSKLPNFVLIETPVIWQNKP